MRKHEKAKKAAIRQRSKKTMATIGAVLIGMGGGAALEHKADMGKVPSKTEAALQQVDDGISSANKTVNILDDGKAVVKVDGRTLTVNNPIIADNGAVVAAQPSESGVNLVAYADGENGVEDIHYFQQPHNTHPTRDETQGYDGLKGDQTTDPQAAVWASTAVQLEYYGGDSFSVAPVDGTKVVDPAEHVAEVQTQAPFSTPDHPAV